MAVDPIDKAPVDVASGNLADMPLEQASEPTATATEIQNAPVVSQRLWAGSLDSSINGNAMRREVRLGGQAGNDLHEMRRWEGRYAPQQVRALKAQALVEIEPIFRRHSHPPFHPLRVVQLILQANSGLRRSPTRERRGPETRGQDLAVLGRVSNPITRGRLFSARRACSKASPCHECIFTHFQVLLSPELNPVSHSHPKSFFAREQSNTERGTSTGRPGL